MMFLAALQRVQDVIEMTVMRTLRTLIGVCLFLTLAHALGWVDRWIWFLLEKEAGKVLNRAKVTMGGFRLDWTHILEGKVTLYASNIVLHTPQQDAWGWESPLVARVGSVSVECNAPITLFHLAFLRRELPVEVYTLQVWDVQVFVERRDQVFNVYLMDPSLELPPPPPRRTINDSTNQRSASMEFWDTVQDQAEDSPSVDRQNQTSSTNDESSNNNNNNNNTTATVLDDHEEQARLLVNDMITAVQSLRKAAKRGSLQSEVKQQGLVFADRLRGLSKKENLEDGMKTLQEVGKVAVESLQSTKEVLPEKRKDGIPFKKDVYCRVGRIVLKDCRIFTKDSWIYKAGDTPSPSGTGGEWNKPIMIEEMVVRASELCPSMSLKDENDLPAVYQHIEKVVEVVWRRLVAEMAKSNSGRLFRTAVGEVLSIIKTTGPVKSTSNPNLQAPAPTPSKSAGLSETSTKNPKPKPEVPNPRSSSKPTMSAVTEEADDSKSEGEVRV